MEACQIVASQQNLRAPVINSGDSVRSLLRQDVLIKRLTGLFLLDGTAGSVIGAV